jgi:HTH-type transcriptional regulator / antitoxin HigA
MSSTRTMSGALGRVTNPDFRNERLPKKSTKSHRIPGVGDRYLQLIHQFPLRPIRSERELDHAIETINSLLDQARRTKDEEDYLDVLGDLVEKYETEHHRVLPVSDAEMLAHLIEAKGETQARVAAAARIAESTISEILAGKRELNRKHIEALARYFHVSPAVFLST